MYPGKYAIAQAHSPAFIMADSGEVVTYGEYEARCNRLAHLLRSQGLKRGDHYAIFMENNSRYLETCGAGERSGLYYTCVNSYLTANELAYILNNSESQILITSEACLAVAIEAIKQCPAVQQCFIVDGADNKLGDRISNLDEATSGFPDAPIPDESLGSAMLYSSGTTGQPKGILRALPEESPEHMIPVASFMIQIMQFRPGQIYLSPAPLYHAAPHISVNLTLRLGGTVIIMERFDPQRYLMLVEKYQVTHSQLVPTMFSKMLKLAEPLRLKYDVSSLEVAVHAAAPCPIQIKRQMIEWWGPIIVEYYGATEGLGFTVCNSEEWLAHPGTVGRVVFGDLKILDEQLQPCVSGEHGTLWFETASEFEYFNDPDRTAQAKSADGERSTVGDIGYLDSDGFLYLSDRAAFMIISGGVNIYPQESENLLITHPKVADAAVFGIPNDEFGEEVKAVVELMPSDTPSEALAQELIAFCKAHLAYMKCPRSIDFDPKLPRLPTGKLYKRELRDRYWGDQVGRII
ncbi:MAG: long-chain acyl-CoA synthetase [Arenicella sp.]|jgi:long-chain acyl-CoA synthetase